MIERATSRTRWARRFVVLAMLAAAAVATVRFTRHQDAAVVADIPVFKTATVEAGSLGVNERIDGSLELSDVTAVVHRIDGQLGTTSASGTSNGGPTSPNAAGLTSATAAGLTAGLTAVDTCATDATTTTTNADTSTTTEPASTTSTSTTTSTTTSTSTTTPTSTTTAPPDSGGAPSTSDPCATTTTTARPGGQGGTGGFPTGGSTGGGTTAGTGGSSTGGTTTRVTQVVTSAIEVGAAVGLGTVLYTVESRPVVALGGSVPAWRTMTTGDTGQDVRQLELSLAALGYTSEGMVVDDEFDDDTATAVAAWQAGYGLEVTGEVTLGSIVFVPSAATVQSVNIAVGDDVADGTVALVLAAASQQVVIDVPDGDEALITPGLEVGLGGSGGNTGIVTLLRSVERSGSVVVQAVIAPSTTLDAVDGAVVTVTVSVDELDGVLVVPSEALVSRLDGNYALQVLLPDGTSEFRSVEILGVSGSTAAVRGEGIEAGMEVLQPA